MPLVLSEESKRSLAAFLERRNMKERVRSILAKIVAQEDLKRGDLTTAKQVTYHTLVDELIKAINKGWYELSALIALLDESEVAGRQHVWVFLLPAKGKAAILDAVASPIGQDDAPGEIEDFIKMPESSYARVLKRTGKDALVKVVTRRRYWVREVDEHTDTEEWIHRWIEEERAAVILKCDLSAGICQVRIPPREHFQQSETGKTVYDFAKETLERHYDIGKNSWFSRLLDFPITDAYPAILANRDDFVLRHDTPESLTAKARVSRTGAIKELKDLRDDSMWVFADGYARKSLRGVWLVADNFVYAHLNYDKVRLDAKSTASFARVFIPSLTTDAEVDHVIGRIREHLP
jgi:hypothetical protein